MSIIPQIKPYNHDKHDCKQSKYEMVSELPTRALIVAPSNSGKSVLLQNIILDIYRGCFEKVFIFSPSIFIDNVWKPVINYCEKELKQVENDKEQFFFDTFDQTQFKNIITTQAKIIKFMKD
jgi:transcription termination factor Rho